MQRLLSILCFLPLARSIPLLPSRTGVTQSQILPLTNLGLTLRGDLVLTLMEGGNVAPTGTEVENEVVGPPLNEAENVFLFLAREDSNFQSELDAPTWTSWTSELDAH